MNYKRKWFVPMAVCAAVVVMVSCGGKKTAKSPMDTRSIDAAERQYIQDTEREKQRR